MADDGRDISEYFTGKGKMKKPVKRVNVDFTQEMLEELECLNNVEPIFGAMLKKRSSLKPIAYPIERVGDKE